MTSKIALGLLAATLAMAGLASAAQAQPFRRHDDRRFHHHHRPFFHHDRYHHHH